MDISKGLTMLLQSNNVSRSRLARELGVHTSTVTNWLDGKDPKSENLSDVCKYFGVDLEFLQTGESPQKEKAPTEAEARKEIVLKTLKSLPEEGWDAASEYIQFLLTKYKDELK